MVYGISEFRRQRGTLQTPVSFHPQLRPAAVGVRTGRLAADVGLISGVSTLRQSWRQSHRIQMGHKAVSVSWSLSSISPFIHPSIRPSVHSLILPSLPPPCWIRVLSHTWVSDFWEFFSSPPSPSSSSSSSSSSSFFFCVEFGPHGGI